MVEREAVEWQAGEAPVSIMGGLGRGSPGKAVGRDNCSSVAARRPGAAGVTLHNFYSCLLGAPHIPD